MATLTTESASSSEPDLIHRIKTGEIRADNLAQIDLEKHTDPEKGSNTPASGSDIASPAQPEPQYKGWNW